MATARNRLKPADYKPLGGDEPEMVDRPLRFTAYARVLIGQQRRNRRNGRHRAEPLQTQGPGGVTTCDRVGIAQFLDQFQNQ